ncbi:MAG: cupin domain-containing protein [Methylophilaceae bacterium]|nr:cupin domain-containing protein [Methyloradius sp.]
MTKTINNIIDFSTNTVEPEYGIVPQERVVTGVSSDANVEIKMTTFNHYTDPTEQFFAGIWHSSVGAKTVNYTEEEVCYILEGRVRLTDEAGNAKEFGAGSTFVLPAGFKGTWETLEAIKKIYVIWQAKD